MRRSGVTPNDNAPISRLQSPAFPAEKRLRNMSRSGAENTGPNGDGRRDDARYFIEVIASRRAHSKASLLRKPRREAGLKSTVNCVA
jgi:hypothetical protein